MTDRQYEPGMEPVFLQALWRTGSTYLWGKFRSRDEFRGYFEPLHEALYCKTREKLKADYDHAVQKYGHSFISHNYYDEFNIRASGGAEHFERRFTLERYAMSPQDEDPELKRYIGSLIDNAANEGQAAVMQFNRGVLRAEWMKRQFGGTHIYLNRNPSDMLFSYKSHNNKSYYLPVYLSIVAQNAHNPIFAEVAEHFGVTPFDAPASLQGLGYSEERIKSRSFTATLRHFSRPARGLSEQDERDLVAFFWTMGLAEATRYADVIVDTDQVVATEGRLMPDILAKATGKEFDFSDLKVKRGETETMEISPEMKRIIRNACDYMEAHWARLKDFPLSANTAVQLISTLQ